MRAGRNWRQGVLDLPFPKLTEADVLRIMREVQLAADPKRVPDSEVDPWVREAMQRAYLAGFDAACPF